MHLTFHAPQVLLVVLFSLSLGLSIARHGQPEEGRRNALYSLVSTAVMFALLYWGGFFG